MIRKYFPLGGAILGVALFVHIGYLYHEVGRGVSENDPEASSILYGRPLKIRKGDDIDNLRFRVRLRKLSYRKVTGNPTLPGTYSEGEGKIRILTRAKEGGAPHDLRPAEMEVQEGRVLSLASPTGEPLEALSLEPEEIGRILGPRLESRQPVRLGAVSPFLQNAVLAAEDARFYSHHGIDLHAIGRALWTNLKEQRFAQGGSTITQQLAKNFFLSPRKTIGRKLREAELALMIEWRYSKNEILEMYLNKIYFGQDGPWGIHGIEAAAAFHFSKPAKDLSLEESALLAGIIRSPNRYSLPRESKAAKERRNAVLARMQKLGMIGEKEFRRAVNTPVRTRQRDPAFHEASYFIDYIQRVTAKSLGEETLYRAGLRYHTTLDPAHQVAAQEAVTGGLAEIEKWAHPAGEPLQAALVAVDPATGEITAMVGGRGYGTSPFNRAASAKRQPGSAFKPFVLLAALSRSMRGKGHLTLSTLVSGEPLALSSPEGVWTPANFEKKSYHNVTARQMIEESVNTAAVRLATDVGLVEVLRTARAAGITSPLAAVPSLALGSFEVTPVELAYAYAAIASGGIRFAPFPLTSVTTADGEILLANEVRRERQIDPRVAYLTGYALEGVLERGTARAARANGISFPAAGKTGTTDGNRDSWFVGYTRDVVCAVWVGYDSGADTGLTGASGALRIWARFMRSLYPHSSPAAMNPPEGVVTVMIDPASGYLATASCPQTLPEAYLIGTSPQGPCPLHPESRAAAAIRAGVKGIADFLRYLLN